MKRIKTAALAAMLSMLTVIFAGCSNNNVSDADHKLRIVCTIFPEYDWVKQIMGEKNADAEIIYLLQNGTDMHNFQPTADDMIAVSDCDLFLYVGGESDKWASDALANAVNKDMKVISLLNTVGDRIREEEIKEGMQSEEEEQEEGPEYDEHVWLSVKNAKTICSAIADDLCELDPENAAVYSNNLAEYSSQLDKLDRDFESLEGSSRTLIFCDRFPFRYFAEDYGFDYFAAFAGCSAETEASFETIAFLAGKVDELGCRTIYTIENSDNKIAKTVIASTRTKDQNIAVLDSIQSVKKSDADSGVSYISLMRKNYEVLKNTL